MSRQLVFEPIFADRADAGRKLGAALSAYVHRTDVIVLGLPRGGVPVAQEVAHALGVPLDIFLVRKLGVPGHRELAMGAIASGNVRVMNQEVADALDIAATTIEAVAERERRELERRERLYRDGRDGRQLAGNIVILVDDGLATGATMRAAIAGVRAHGPTRIVVAVPVASAEICAELEQHADEVVCLETPVNFVSVGAWYRDFSQTRDLEVQRALRAANST